MPLTNKEKCARMRAKKIADGLVPINLYGTPQQKADFKLVISGKAKIVRINPLDSDGRVY